MAKLFLLLALTAVVAVSARLEARETFTTQGLELLEGRYGTAYPGYASNVGQLQYGMGGVGLQTQNQAFGVGQVMQQQQPILGSSQFLQAPIQSQMFQQQPMMLQQQQQPIMLEQQQQPIVAPQQFGLGEQLGQQPMSIGAINPIGLSTLNPMPTYGTVGVGATQTLGATGLGLGMDLAQPATSFGSVGSFGGVGAFGSGAQGTSKKTTVAAPIYAQSMIVPKVITQPILRPHLVQQPIVQQQLIQQPIVETRQVIQPVIRRIITQPIIRPEIFESTTIQPTLKTETTVQPHIIQQTVVTPTMSNEYSEVAPIQEQARTQVAPSQVLPVQSAKKGQRGLSMQGTY